MMQHALPRRIKLAFIVQALVASIVITGMTMLGASLVRRVVVQDTMEREAEAFWAAPGGDAAQALPRGRTITSYFVPAGDAGADIPAELRNLAPGMHRVEAFSGHAV